MRLVLASLLCVLTISASAAKEPLPETVAKLVNLATRMDGLCRRDGVHQQGDCERRDRLYAELLRLGYCYGPQPGAVDSLDWHRCTARPAP